MFYPRAKPSTSPLSSPTQLDVLTNYPPQTPAEGEKPPGLHDMVIFTKGPKDYWPADRIPWLQDAYPVPHFVREMHRKETEGKEGAVARTGAAKQ